MMATESPKDTDRSNEATLTTEFEPTIKIDSAPQDVESDKAQVNGDAGSSATDDIDNNKAISDIIDNLVNSAEVSISGGSDNEANSSKNKDDDKGGHGRTLSSVKKPASFKAVSVNKKFLAAKGATPSAPATTGDKAGILAGLAPSSSSSATSGARPRLVVKSGSGLVAKSGAGKDGKPSTPDPSAVWNKNRPVPPPEPKKYTDEELKKYGIHMTSRLKSDSDDTKGHANWADIDDDDDDGDYLETITWKDGTKITLPHVEEPARTPAPAAPAAPAQAPSTSPTANANHVPAPVENAPSKEKTVPAAEKPNSPAPGPPPVRTLPSGKGLVLLKGAPEKPTLVAKPPAPPMPAKSPWAKIPKVENASPIVPELPATQQNGPRFIGRDAAAPRGMTPPPPKEIAVDDFHRSPWKDGSGAQNRELFNSQSGRYEPVQDRRGPAMRNDQYSRQHQHPGPVLQRAIVHETQGPAEPSSAFQTSRTSDQHVPYGRRRGSSNVSGGSGQFMRYKGHEQHPLGPPEFQGGDRRESFGAISDRPVSPVRNFSASGQSALQLPPGQLHSGPQRLHSQPHNSNNRQNWQQPISPALANSHPHQLQQPHQVHQQFHHNQDQSLPHHHSPQSVIGEMNPPTETTTAPTQPAAPAVAPVVTEQDYALQKRLMQERRELAMKRRLEQEAKEEAERKERIRLKLEAMGPAPVPRSAKQAAKQEESASAPAQAAETIQKPEEPTTTQATNASIETHKQELLQPSPSIAKATTEPEHVPKSLLPPTTEQVPAPVSTSNQPESNPQVRGQSRGHPSWPHSTPQQEPQPRFTSAPYTQTSWTGREPMGAVSSNVWGSPNNDRSLGNGTFTPDLLNAPIAGPPAKHVPGPIGPPGATRGHGQQQQQQHPRSNTASVVKPAPIGPPSRQLPFQRPDAAARNATANAWAAMVQQKDVELQEEMNVRRAAQDHELQNQGLTPEDVQAPIADTWRPTKLDHDGMRKEERLQRAYHPSKAPGWVSQQSEAPVSPIDRQPSGGYNQMPLEQPPTSILGGPTSVAPQLTKSSRFFPNSRDVRQEMPMVNLEQQHRSSSPSPPPPDMAGHPAFDGDVSRPQVHLPPSKPRVRLPPAPAPVQVAPEARQPAFGWANPAPYREADASTTQNSNVTQRRPSVPEGSNWQDKFDNLLHQGRKPTSPPKLSVPVVSASRSSLEHPQYTRSATVSLPLVARNLFKNLPADNGSSITKDMAEDCFEEQEMGSVPPVRLPKQVSQLAWHPCPTPRAMPKKFWVMPDSADMLTFHPTIAGGGTVVHVFVPGMPAPKDMTIPFSRTRSNPRRPRNSPRNASQPYRGGKSREASASYPNEHSSAPHYTGSNTRGRGGYRGGGRDYLPRHQGSAPIPT